MILCFPAFIPRSGPSYPFAFNEPVDSPAHAHTVHTRAHVRTHSRSAETRVHARKRAHREPGSPRRSQESFPQFCVSSTGIIHRVPWNFYDFHERRATSPIEIWRYRRSVGPRRLTRNREAKRGKEREDREKEKKRRKEKERRKRTRVKFREIVSPYANRVKNGDT